MTVFRAARPLRVGRAVLLLTCCAGLSAVVAYPELPAESARYLEAPGEAYTTAMIVGIPKREMQPFEFPPLSDFEEIAARPLFEPSRRPPWAGGARGPASKARLDSGTGHLHLSGTASAGATRIALVRNGTTGEILRLSEGEIVSGWRIASISPRSIVLRRDGEEVTLALKH